MANHTHDTPAPSPSPARSFLMVAAVVFAVGAIGAFVGEAPEVAGGFLVLTIVLGLLAAKKPKVADVGDRDTSGPRDVALPLIGFAGLMAVLIVIGFLVAS